MEKDVVEMKCEKLKIREKNKMNRKKTNIVKIGTGLLLSLTLVFAATPTSSQCSKNFRLTTSVLDEAGGAASSFNYKLVALTLGQPSPVGESKSDYFDGFIGYIYTLDAELCGIRGDVNNDCTMNVLDVVQTVIEILDPCTLDSCAKWRADCNADGDINVLDALGIVNVILGLGTCPPIEVGS